MLLSEIIQIERITKGDSTIGSQLYADSDFSDVTLVCGDNQHLPAHRAVLCASSTFLRQLLYDSQHQRTFLYLGPVAYEDLRSLLELMYLGSCSVLRVRREAVLALAFTLGVEGVLEKVEDVTNVLEEVEEAISLVKEGVKVTGALDENQGRDVFAGIGNGNLTKHRKEILSCQKENRKKIQTCPECQKKVGHDNISRHMKENHNKEKYTCSKCSKLLTRKKSLTKHTQKGCMMDQNIVPICCENNCGKRFQNIRVMKYHIKNRRCPITIKY